MLEDYLRLEPNLFILNSYGENEQTKNKKISDLETKLEHIENMFSILSEKIKKNESS